MTMQEVQVLIRKNLVLYRNTAKPLSEADAAILVGTWAEHLADVPSYAGKLAFDKALEVCTFPVTLANIYTQLRKLQSESEPNAATLWGRICETAHKASENRSLYGYTGHLQDGRTQGQAAKEANKKLFDCLPMCVQRYFGSLQALIDFDSEDATGKSYRRWDFEKFYAEDLMSRPIDPLKLPQNEYQHGKLKAHKEYAQLK